MPASASRLRLTQQWICCHCCSAKGLTRTLLGCLHFYCFTSLFFFFTPVYNLLRIVKHQHSIRKLLQFLGTVLVYFTHPLPSLLLKKKCTLRRFFTPLCAPVKQWVINWVFCLVRRWDIIYSTPSASATLSIIVQSWYTFLWLFSFPLCIWAHTPICWHIGLVISLPSPSCCQDMLTQHVA